jgi:hypothetical protein
MTDVSPATVRWRKSSYSNALGECVEVGATSTMIAVRDSKDPDGPILTFSAPTWETFLATIT